jgi:peptidoglycan/xylan/chitin deacetylase (PgdA/CDA1 family)
MVESKDHDIACHTFSHVDFSNPKCTEEVARYEIEAWRKASRGLDISSKSFVFPRNNPNYLELLPEYGFDRFAVEGESQDFFNPSLPSPHTLPDNGILVIPRTLQVSAFKLPDPRRIGKLSRLMMYWRKKGGFLHLWTHEWSLVSRRDLMILNNVVKFLARYGEGIRFSDL